MSRREKLYHLHDILRQRRTPVSRQHLMEELGCSQATLYRLIAELRDVLGAPLEQDPESRHYFYDRSLAGNFELPGLWISPEELQALLTARQILSNVQPGLLQDELDQLQQRMSQLIDAEGIDFSAHPERVHIRHDAGRPVPGRLFEDLLRTLFAGRRVRIRYHGRRRDAVSEREISPQRLTSYRDRWYLDAWCHQAEGLRSFAVERITEITALEDASERIDAEDLHGHFDQAYGIFSGPAEHTAEIRFSAEAARWAPGGTGIRSSRSRSSPTVRSGLPCRSVPAANWSWTFFATVPMPRYLRRISFASDWQPKSRECRRPTRLPSRTVQGNCHGSVI